MSKYFHSVMLIEEFCKGCTTCVRRCPTEAIRVRYGKALIIKERCIDCGECIRVCPHHAKQSIVSSLSTLKNYKYTVALPAPSLYAQFNNLTNTNIVVNALKYFGFDMVYEVSKAAELVSESTKLLLAQNTLTTPVLSSACPAILRLISVRFPELIQNILPLKAPVALAAYNAKKIASEETGLDFKDIGVIFITPCPAKVTESKAPLFGEDSFIDECISIRDIYPKLLPLMKMVEPITENLVPEKVFSNSYKIDSGKTGIGWAGSGGESYGLGIDDYLAADGIENVIRVLEDLEDEKFSNLTFVELNACPGGCVGGVLTVENPFIAHTKLKMIKKKLPKISNSINNKIPDGLLIEKDLEYVPILRLDENLVVASQKLAQLEDIVSGLYGLDCGSCGAPSCRSLAEDIVRGFATEDYCVYKMAEKTAKDSDEQSNPLPIAFRSSQNIEQIKLRREALENGDKQNS